MITVAIIYLSLTLTFSLCVVYCHIRLKKVTGFRNLIITFCASDLDSYEDRFRWYDTEIKDLNKIVSSFAPLESFIVGKYKNEFLKFYARRK